MTRTSTKDAAESALRELPSVVGAFVREDIFGHPREVHILVTAGPAPRDLARDVRDLLEERLGVPVDQRVISIAQLARAPVDALPSRRIAELPATAAVEAATGDALDIRLRLVAIEIEAGNGRVSAAVRLALGSDEHVGWGAEVESDVGRLRAGATAAAQAVTLALGTAGRIELEGCAVTEGLGRDYGLVATQAAASRLGRRPLPMFGAHPLQPDPVEAGVYATLKSANRIASLLLRNAPAPQRPRAR
jgi:hypothetical protein